MPLTQQINAVESAVTCSFCDASSDMRFYMIIGPKKQARICNECIEEAHEQLTYACILAAHTQQDLMH